MPKVTQQVRIEPESEEEFWSPFVPVYPAPLWDSFDFLFKLGTSEWRGHLKWGSEWNCSNSCFGLGPELLGGAAELVGPEAGDPGASTSRAAKGL